MRNREALGEREQGFWPNFTALDTIEKVRRRERREKKRKGELKTDYLGCYKGPSQ